MRAIACELWGGPGCGATITIPSEPTSDIPSWDPYIVPIGTDQKPMIGDDAVGVVIGHAVYSRTLPRHNRWIYRYVGMDTVTR